jgi:DNA-binding NtrC family response regulator
VLETRALVADDEPLVLDALGQLLRKTVRRVDQASDGQHAIELFAAHQHPVVVLDLVMPGMTGLDAMAHIHRLQPRTQVIIVTGFASKETAIRALNLHAFALLEKPVTLDQLSDVVVAAWTRYVHGDAAPAGARSETQIETQIEAQIEALYNEVSQLGIALERTPDDPQLHAAYSQGMARLRRAQAIEADSASRAFRNSLALKPGTGYAAVEAARLMLDRDKNPA